jgi:carbon monoxide dehydrogenase subunit G
VDLSHQFRVPASVEETWRAFNDLERVAPCFPGATLTSAEGDTFSGTVKVKLGPISMQYSGTGTWKQRDESAKRAVIEARGKDKRGNGTASAHVTAQLTPAGSGTSVSVVTELNVTGKPAQFGRGVMQDVSDKLLGQFVACLTEQLSGADARPATEDSSTSAGVDAPGEPAGTPASTTASTTLPADPPDGPDGLVGGQPAERLAPNPAPVAGRSSGQSAQPAAEVELDLVGTVLPVLARRYAAPAAGVLVALLVLRRLNRR